MLWSHVQTHEGKKRQGIEYQNWGSTSGSNDRTIDWNSQEDPEPKIEKNLRNLVLIRSKSGHQKITNNINFIILYKCGGFRGITRAK